MPSSASSCFTRFDDRSALSILLLVFVLLSMRALTRFEKEYSEGGALL